MRIESQKAMDRYRGAGVCGHCKKTVRNLDPHHLFTRGAGRLDVSINLIGLCTTFAGGDNCHQGHHDGHEPTKVTLMALVAQRENCLQDDLETCIHILRWLPKEARPKDVEAAFVRFSANDATKATTGRVLSESGF